MSIVDLQLKARRLGEIRLGDTVVNKNGKTVPISLDTFRLTSVAKGLLDQAAKLWGGKVVPWQASEKSAAKWQLVTDTSELPVYVAPQDPDSVTWYESWTAGGLQRRCDGESIVNRGGEVLPCVCDPENRECRMVTRLQVMLPDLPDVGVWTLSSTGFYAASEIAMSIQIVMKSAQVTGALPEAVLAIEHRESKKPGEATKKFVVPVLRFADSLGSFMELPSGSAPSLPVGADDGGGGDGTVHSLPTPAPIEQEIHVDPKADLEPQLTEGLIEFATKVAEAEATVKLMETRSRLQAEADEEFVFAEGEEPFDTTKPEGDDLTWVSLLSVLEENPDEGIMGVIQDRVRRLYRMMAAVGLWAENARAAMLMKHYNEEHLEDLRRPELKQFAEKSFDAARRKVKEAE